MSFEGLEDSPLLSMAITITWWSFRAVEVKLRVVLIRPPKPEGVLALFYGGKMVCGRLQVGIRTAPFVALGLNDRYATLMSLVVPFENLKSLIE